MEITKAYRIETDRLVIRCYQPSDAPKFQEAITLSLANLLPWMPWAKYEPESLEAKVNHLRSFREQFHMGKDFVYAIFDKTENEFIGSTGLHPTRGPGAREIGYWISVKHMRQGFALEAVCALLKVAFELEQLDRIEIRCDPENFPSQGIPRKLGFQLQAAPEIIQQDAISQYS